MAEDVVLITGASSGIGEATARAFVAAGSKVVLGARRTDRLEALVAELGDESAVAQECDVTDAHQVQALVDLALERFGRLDVAFANAGFGGGGTIADGDPAVWKEMLLTNVYGLALTMHYAVQPMLEAGRGHLVLTSSVTGRQVFAGRNHMYSASKFAVGVLGECARKELTGKVRVTVIEPGWTNTDFDTWPEGALEPTDVADLIVHAVNQPARIAVNEILVRPSIQEF
jgi:NADP-dependent 3-hydroxy acid dehydrogenase YdfG